MTSVEQRPAGRGRLLGLSFGMVGLYPMGIILFCVTMTSLSLCFVWIGLPIALLSIALLRWYADLHRLMAMRVLGTPVGRSYREERAGGWLSRVSGYILDPATWRDIVWTLVNMTAGAALSITSLSLFLGAIGHATLWTWWWALPSDAEVNLVGFLNVNSEGTAACVGLVLGAVYLLLWWVTLPWLMRGWAMLTSSMLAPSERARLANRVRELAESRRDTVDSQAAELRRIERDLHDGAQARLVSLGMSLGLAEELMAKDPESAQELLAEARTSTTAALSELRDLVRGIHPPVLADRGLAGAVQALGLANPLPVEVSVELPGRPPAPVESAAYFAVAETLTNMVKHAGAGSAWVRIRYSDGRLGLMVGDDGHGGAVIVPGGGLHGIERRLAAFDGTMSVASPAGGPTIVTMEIPCELFSPKTSPSCGTA